MPWDRLQVQDDRIVANVTEDQVAMPRWEKGRPAGEFAEYKPYR